MVCSHVGIPYPVLKIYPCYILSVSLNLRDLYKISERPDFMDAHFFTSVPLPPQTYLSFRYQRNSTVLIPQTTAGITLRKALLFVALRMEIYQSDSLLCKFKCQKNEHKQILRGFLWQREENRRGN